jgi:O-antigen/teichoic acid export membrane protein
MSTDAVLLDRKQRRPGSRPEAHAARHVRGSSLLLAGRVISMVANFGIQVLIVRHFSKSDYGAFAYALSIVHLVTTVVTLGLDRGITRFVAIYDEQKAYSKLFGTIVMQLVAIVSLGLTATVLVYALQDWMTGTLVDDRQAVSVLLVLIILAPVQALDDMFVQLFAVFARPGAIFFRRHVLAPGLRLVVVALLIAGHRGVSFLAAGYVAATAVGVLLSGGLLLRVMAKQGLLRQARAAGLEFPLREVAAYTLPLLTSDLVYMLMGTATVVMLGHYRATDDVAAFRAVVPLAHTCQLVMTSFSLLFTPTASRLFARGDRASIGDLYWRTAAWMAVLTFPIFALTFSLADPVTTTLFGSRYAGSAAFLAIVAVGYYFNSALGFNGLTLKVFSRLRYLVTINLAVAGLNLVLNVVLIPRYGALGAALATAATLIAHNVGKQAGLRSVGIALFPRRYLRLYGAVTVLSAGLLAVQYLADLPLLPGLALAGIASVAVVVVSRDQLDVNETFPELLRIPLVRRIGRLPGAAR